MNCATSPPDRVIGVCESRRIAFIGTGYVNVTHSGEQCRCDLVSSRSADYVITVISRPPHEHCLDQLLMRFPLGSFTIFCTEQQGMRFQSRFTPSAVTLVPIQRHAKASIDMCIRFAPKYFGPDMATITIKCETMSATSELRRQSTSISPKSKNDSMHVVSEEIVDSSAEPELDFPTIDFKQEDNMTTTVQKLEMDSPSLSGEVDMDFTSVRPETDSKVPYPERDFTPLSEEMNVDYATVSLPAESNPFVHASEPGGNSTPVSEEPDADVTSVRPEADNNPLAITAETEVDSPVNPQPHVDFTSVSAEAESNFGIITTARGGDSTSDSEMPDVNLHSVRPEADDNPTANVPEPEKDDTSLAQQLDVTFSTVPSQSNIDHTAIVPELEGNFTRATSEPDIGWSTVRVEANSDQIATVPEPERDFKSITPNLEPEGPNNGGGQVWRTAESVVLALSLIMCCSTAA